MMIASSPGDSVYGNNNNNSAAPHGEHKTHVTRGLSAGHDG